MNRRAIYTALAVIFAASIGSAAFFHSFPLRVVGDLAGIPAVLALFGALFQLARDSLAFERSVRLEEARNRFTVGATSHMADVAFDKHVEFCEQYVEEMFTTLENLFRKGPSEDALQHASSLYGIRKARAVWLTPEIEADLERFEAALRKIGANAQLLKMVPGTPEAIKEMFSEFAHVFGAKYGFKQWAGEPVTQERTIEAVIVSLRKILGIDELTRLRGELIKSASSDFKT